MQSVTDMTFRELLIARILDPLDLRETLPAPSSAEEAAYNSGNEGSRFQSAWDLLATPYHQIEGQGNVETSYINTYFGSAAGLISSVMDYAIFDIAIDRNRLLSAEAQEEAWTPFVSNSGQDLPYGYGWFVDQDDDLRYIWHYGFWDGTTTLIVKVPERNLTFLMFANVKTFWTFFAHPEWESSPEPCIGSKTDILCSPAARAFLNAFIADH